MRNAKKCKSLNPRVTRLRLTSFYFTRDGSYKQYSDGKGKEKTAYLTIIPISHHPRRHNPGVYMTWEYYIPYTRRWFAGGQGFAASDGQQMLLHLRPAAALTICRFRRCYSPHWRACLAAEPVLAHTIFLTVHNDEWLHIAMKRSCV